MQSLSDSIQKLAATSGSPSEFYQGLVKNVATGLDADAGVIWDKISDQFRAIGQYSRTEKPAKIPLSQEDHSKLLARAAAQTEPIAVKLPAPAGDATILLLVGRFAQHDSRLMELFVNAPQADAQQLSATFMGMLQTVSRVELPTANELQNRSSRTNNAGIEADATQSSRQLPQSQMSDYLNTIHRSIDQKMACSNVANETRRVFDCDRVSVLLRQRGKYRILSISGQPSVNRRSNTTKLLEKLANRLLKTGECFWYPEETEIPTKVSEVLDEYLAISATRSLVVQPIYEKVTETVADPESLERKRNLVIGGIVYEHCHERWERGQIEPIVDFASLHGGNAIRNAKQHHNLFLYPLMNLLGKSRVLMATRMLPKTLLALGAILLATLILTLWQVDFYVTADGILIPREISPVFAKVDGDVTQLMVEHGSSVQQGDPLVKLTSREHEIRAKDLESKIASSEQRLETIQDRIFEQDETSETAQENLESLKAQITNFKEQQTILTEIGSNMTIVSPLEGRVISWDLEQRLQGRAIQRGQELMEVAAINGEWQLEIELPIRRYSHLIKELDNNPEPEISFLLAADSSTRYLGKVVEVEAATSVNSSNEQFVRLRADLSSKEIEIAQARTGVTTQIYCGRTSLGYFLLHDIGEFIQKNILFRLY